MSGFGCTPHAHELKSGPRFGHCGACHLNFMGVGAFDKHRRGPHDARYCVDPASDDGRTREGRPIAQWWTDSLGRFHEGPRYEYEKKEEVA